MEHVVKFNTAMPVFAGRHYRSIKVHHPGSSQPTDPDGDRAGSQPVEISLHGLFPDGHYYYVVDGAPAVTTPYPVVPSFRDWEFRDNDMPEEWKITTACLTGSVFCQVTKFPFLEQAHLVPRAEEAWWRHSNLGCTPLDDAQNMVLLRADLHSLFDRKNLAFVPKRPDPAHPHSYEFLAHILDTDRSYHAVLQNSTLQPGNEDGTPLYACFAWSILHRTKGFLTAGPGRVVSVRSDTGNTVVKTITCAELNQAYGGSGLRDAAPLQRTRPRRSGDICDDDDYDYGDGGYDGHGFDEHGYDDDDYDYGDGGYDGHGFDEHGYDDYDDDYYLPASPYDDMSQTTVEAEKM